MPPEGLYRNSFALNINFNPIQDGGQKGSPISFSIVAFTKVVISPKNFLTFSFNPFVAVV